MCVFIGCIISENPGGHERSSTPINETAASETTRTLPNVPPATPPSIPPSSPSFQALHDTVRTAVIIEHSSKPIQTGEQSSDIRGVFYTIQVGAYNDASNALRCQRIAKERFPDQQVLNEYDETAKLYRVSIGQFPSRESATVFLQQLQRRFPQEYRQCWIKQVEF